MDKQSDLNPNRITATAETYVEVYIHGVLSQLTLNEAQFLWRQLSAAIHKVAAVTPAGATSPLGTAGQVTQHGQQGYVQGSAIPRIGA